MSKRYTGGVVSSSLPTVNAAGASGVFLLSQQADYQSRNAWPPYKIEESLWFRRSALGYLNRTPASASNQKTWTWSGWVKRGSLGSFQRFFTARNDINDESAGLRFDNSDKLDFIFQQDGSASITGRLVTTQVFRDSSAWYHIVFTQDTTNAISGDRLRLWINGVEVTVFTTDTAPTQNHDGYINSTNLHRIGSESHDTAQTFDGYLAEVNFIDGQALTPSSFGATDKDGNWSPIAYTGTYGTNGFYVNFRDNTSAATTGYDYSGNGNNWTLNGFNVSTANTTYDIMIDVPEDQAGANNRGNYATLNPAIPKTYCTQTDGNLKSVGTDSTDSDTSVATIGVSSGKWYWEDKIGTINSAVYPILGAGRNILPSFVGAYPGIASVGGFGLVVGNGNIVREGSTVTTVTALTTNDVVGFALDLDALTVAIYKNGALLYTITGLTAGTYYPMANEYSSSNSTHNYGQQPFAYAPPSGFKALNTFNLPDPTIKQPNKQFDVSLWTGNGSTQSITGLNFKPDLVWVKVRSSTQNHSFNDPLRGAGNYLVPNATAAERFQGEFTSFNSDGFSLTYNAAEGDYNFSGKTYVGWSWNAGGANTTNTSGSITSLVRANPTAGFSIVTYTGTGANATVGHGLGTTPSMIMVKQRSASGEGWQVYHSTLGATKYLYLNETTAASTSISRWNNTEPTSSVFSIYNDSSVGANGSTYAAYCFAPIAGYSAFGSYTGNGSTDGPFVYTGFRPRFILTKAIQQSSQWFIWDAARSPFNASNDCLFPESSQAETADNSALDVDFLSNGFKIRNTGSGQNNSGYPYIYMAFAEMPFKYARSR